MCTHTHTHIFSPSPLQPPPPISLSLPLFLMHSYKLRETLTQNKITQTTELSEGCTIRSDSHMKEAVQPVCYHGQLQVTRALFFTRFTHQCCVSTLHAVLQHFFAFSHMCVPSDAHQSIKNNYALWMNHDAHQWRPVHLGFEWSHHKTTERQSEIRQTLACKGTKVRLTKHTLVGLNYLPYM